MAIKELFWDQRPVVLFDPKASGRIDPRFTYTRASTGSYVDERGVLRLLGADINQPRLDYNPATGELRGLLLEPARTNQMTFTEKLTTGWINANYVKTENFAIAPDGTQTATRFKPPSGLVDPGNSTYTVRTYRAISNPVNVGPGVTLTASVYIKPIVKTSTYINPPDTVQVTRDVYLIMTLEGGVGTGWFNTNTLATSSNAGYEDAGNGWYRVWFTGTTTVNDSQNYFFLQMENRASGVGFDPYPDGNEEFYLWGAQVEQGPYPTSYIPCPTGTSVSRAADLLSLDYQLPSKGSIYVDSQVKGFKVNDTIFSIKNSSNQKIDLAFLSSTNTFNSTALLANYNGTNKTTLPLPVPTTSRERNIVTWGTNNYQYKRDGSRFAPSLSSSVPSGLNSLSIGRDSVDPTKAFGGYINNVYVWNGELTPDIAEAMIRNEIDAVNADTFSPVGPAGALSLVINTQGAAVDGSKVFTLPAESALNDNDIVITWGDNTESGLAGAAAEVGAAGLAHTYPAAGIYPVYVEGKLQNLFFNNSADAKDLLQISAWGTTAGGNAAFTAPSTMNSAFYGCTQLQSIPSTNLPNTSAVTDWFRAFRNCSSLTGTFRSFNFSAATTFQEAFYNCSGITSFTAAGDQTQNVTNFSFAWFGCSGLTSFPLINTSAGTNFSSAWFGCSGLTSFPLINTSAGTSFTAAWQICSGLTSFPLINTSAGTSFVGAWKSCSGLTSFPLINTAAGTNFTDAWSLCTGLTSFPLINTAAGTNFNAAWFGCTGLTSFPLIDTAAGTTFGSAWLGCSGLTSFPLINTAAGTNFSNAWNGCSGLTSFPLINTAAGTNFSVAWRNNDGLTAFPALDFDSATGLASDASNTYTGFRETWFSCGALTTFPPNLFDNTTCTRYLDAFTSCALTAASIENIIVSINAAGTSNGNLSLQGGTNAGASTWTANAVTAYDALVARGWTITRNA